MQHRLYAATLWLLGFLIVLTAAPTLVAAQAVDDWGRIAASRKLIIGTSADYPPFEFYNSQFRLDGFDIALARELGKRLGVTVEVKDIAFSGLLDALQLGQVDAVMSALSVTPDRQQIVDFTNLYFIDDDAVLTLKSNPAIIRSATDFAGLRVGTELGTTYHYWAQENLVDVGILPQAALVDYADTLALVRGLRAGEVDAILLGRLPAFVFNMSSQDLHPAGRGLNQQRMAIALRKGSNLVTPLNQALLAIQADGTYAQLAAQYLKLDADEVTHDDAAAGVTNPPAQPLPAPACIPGMTFVGDLNLDDHNMTVPPVMAPGQSFVKSWRVRNNGTCTWAADYLLLYVSGNRVEAAMASQPLRMGRAVLPGETIDLSVTMVAPRVPGTYQGFYQMRDTDGKLFGEVMWVGIQVPDPNPPPAPTPVPQPPAGQINPNLRADSTWVNAGQCTTIRWDVDNINAIYFVDGGNTQGVGGHDARTVCPGGTWTYSVRIVRTDGSTVEFPITINVTGQAPAPSGPSINRFTVDRNEVRAGECVRFEWRADNADGINLYRGGNRVVAGAGREGAYSDCPPEGRHDFDLEAYGNGHTSQRISVNVVGSGGGRGRDE